MDPNDPRRRLQALNSQSPSIRIAAAPQPQVNIAIPKPSQIAINSPAPNQQAPAPQTITFRGEQPNQAPVQAPAPVQKKRSVLGSIGNFITAPYRPLAAGVARLLPGGQNDAKANQDQIDQLANTQATYTQLFHQGKITRDKYAQLMQSNSADFQAAGTEANRIGDTADKSQVVGSALMTAAAPFVGAAGAAPSLTTRIAAGAAEGLGTGVANELAVKADPTGKDLAEQGALGLGVGGMFPAAGAGIKAVASKLGLKFGGKTADVITKLATTNSESVVKKELSSVLPESSNEIRDVVASYIAKEDNPDAIRQIITSLTETPNSTVSIIDPSRPPQSFLNEHLPGTHVPGMPDPVETLSEKAKAFTDPAEFNQYLGTLQGEEKAMAEAGLSGKSPDEFYNTVKGSKEQQVADATNVPGGTQLPPEDLAAIQAAGGTPPKDAAPDIRFTEAGHNAKDVVKDPSLANIISTSASSDTVDPLNTVVSAMANSTKKSEIEKMAEGLYPGIPNGFKNQIVKRALKADTPEEVNKIIDEVVTEAKAAQTVIPKDEFSQEVNQLSDAQTGTSESQVAGDGKTTDSKAVQGDIPSQIDESTANATNTPKSPENGSQGITIQKAEDVASPGADDTTKNAIQEVLDQLNTAQTHYDANAKVRSGEKAARAAAGRAAYDAAGGGEQGVRAKLGALKGKYSESGFSPITASESTQQTILDDIQNSGLRDFEKLNTQNAIRKIWGANPEKPTPSDINYIRKYFGEDMATAIADAVEKDPQNWRDVAAKIAGTPRALMATADFSFGGRQGAPLGTRFPKEWARANKESVKYAANKQYFEKSMQEIRDDDAYETIADRMKVALTAADSKNMEEGFAAADLAEKIPGVGHIVNASDRAYAGGLTKLRFDTAKKIIDSYGGVDQFNKFFEGNDKAFSDLGEVINTFSGRGGKSGGLVEQHMKTLSTTLFAPRLWAAKLNSLNPAFYARLSPEARKLALQTQGAFLTTAGTVLAIAGAAGATVVWDPRSADFAKIKVGNTRYDILGGLQQNIRLIAQEATGQKVNSQTGELATLGDGFGKPSRKDILVQAFENKENPLLAYATKLLEGKDQSGQPVNPLTEGAKLGIPLNAQGAYETSKDVGSAAKGIAMNAPGFVGVGVQTYGSTPTKNQGKDSNGKLAFKGKVTPDMVLNPDGKPMLDAKGKVIKVKFEKDATDLQKQAQLDIAQKAALKSEFLGKQSKEDQQLMKLSDSELQKYADDGKIDQNRYDQIQRLQKGATDYGHAVTADKGLKSPNAQTFSKHLNSLDKKDQESFLNSATPDSSATAITAELNKDRSAGLDEYKPSNKLAHLYSKYEASINNNPDYTEVDKRNKAKAFQTAAYKLNYNQDQNDIFAEGGSSDLRTLIDNKQIDKKDLDEAMKMDEQLYTSGLTGTLKFSKKFRESYGYSVPDGGNGPNGGQGGSKSDSVNAHLADYLPNQATTNQGGEKPTFSSKRRTNGISFKNVNLPGKATKKVSIKL